MPIRRSLIITSDIYFPLAGGPIAADAEQFFFTPPTSVETGAQRVKLPRTYTLFTLMSASSFEITRCTAWASQIHVCIENTVQIYGKSFSEALLHDCANVSFWRTRPSPFSCLPLALGCRRQKSTWITSHPSSLLATCWGCAPGRGRSSRTNRGVCSSSLPSTSLATSTGTWRWEEGNKGRNRIG